MFHIFPSENIQREFRQIEERIGVDNPFEEVRDVLLDIQDDLRDLSFDDEFDINIDEYLPPDIDDLTQSPCCHNTRRRPNNDTIRCNKHH